MLFGKPVWSGCGKGQVWPGLVVWVLIRSQELSTVPRGTTYWCHVTALRDESFGQNEAILLGFPCKYGAVGEGSKPVAPVAPALAT